MSRNPLRLRYVYTSGGNDAIHYTLAHFFPERGKGGLVAIPRI